MDKVNFTQNDFDTQYDIKQVRKWLLATGYIGFLAWLISCHKCELGLRYTGFNVFFWAIELFKVVYHRCRRYYFEIKIQGLELIGIQLVTIGLIV